AMERRVVPNQRTDPESGFISPPAQSRSAVFPAPAPPATATHAPGATASDTSLSVRMSAEHPATPARWMSVTACNSTAFVMPPRYVHGGSRPSPPHCDRHRLVSPPGGVASGAAATTGGAVPVVAGAGASWYVR